MGCLMLVVGLGNPGVNFARTRHNVGFRLIERLAGEQAAWKDFRGLGRWTRQDHLILAQPLTYMNDSGRFVSAFAHFHKIGPEGILVCFDDIALPLGKIRIRASGSAGGQKGMQSIIQSLATEDIPRLRIGIGPKPQGRDSADFVLSRFSAVEEERLAEALERGTQAVRMAREEGLACAMNRFNLPGAKA